MRTNLITALAVVGLALACSAPASAAYPPGTTPFCVSGRGCVPTTNASYTACYQLGLQRGFNTSKGDRRNFDIFILQCLAGRIPR